MQSYFSSGRCCRTMGRGPVGREVKQGLAQGVQEILFPLPSLCPSMVVAWPQQGCRCRSADGSRLWPQAAARVFPAVCHSPWMLSPAWRKERSCPVLFHGIAVSVSVAQRQEKNTFPAVLEDESEQSRSSKGVACAKLNQDLQPHYLPWSHR